MYMLLQDLHLAGNFSHAVIQSGTTPGPHICSYFFLKSAVAELGQGKPTRCQKTTRYLL